MSMVVIGMDPHKRSATIEVMASDETVLGGGRYGTHAPGYRAMVAAVRHWPERVLGYRGMPGHRPAHRHAADRRRRAGRGRAARAVGAHPGVRHRAGPQDRRHRRALGLIPGGAKKALPAAQARALLATVRPRDAAGKARRRVAAELVSDLERIHQRKKAADRELRELLKATGTTLTCLNGIGPPGAARLLAEASDITRFPSKAHFASWNGTAPIDASSGDQVRHRLSRAGNRQVNRALHIMAVVQLRHRRSEGRAYHDRKVAAGKTPMEAMRCLKRRLSDIACHQMILDARMTRTGPGGHSGTTLQSSVTGPAPEAGSSDKPLPGPASQQPRAISLTPS